MVLEQAFALNRLGSLDVQITVRCMLVSKPRNLLKSCILGIATSIEVIQVLLYEKLFSIDTEII